MSNKNQKFYRRNGYLKVKLFNKKEISLLKKKIILDLKKKYFSKFKKNLDLVKLENYHKLNIEEIQHKFLVKPAHRYFLFEKKLVKKILNKEIIDLIKNEWGHSKISLNWIGDLKKKQKIKNATGYRVARPYKNAGNDTAGVHIDVNAGGIINKDIKSTLTIWIPIVGFSKKFTLKIAPKSHIKKHNVKFKKTKEKVTPLLMEDYWKKFKFKRLNYKPGEALVFHPNLLHGGSDNLGSNTRISLDTRVLNLKRFKY